LDVPWNQEIWIPILTPTMTHRVELSVWDYDRLKEDDRVGTVFFRFDDIKCAPLPPTWFPIYGAPDNVPYGEHKNHMNR
jgi:hypothetical protein